MKVVRVAAGVLQGPDGQILLAQRPEGKIAAGRWEFPGGKIEPGESAQQALERELKEEIGVQIEEARPLIRLRHAYTERVVELDTWLVTKWSGQPRGLEQQALSWCLPDSTEDFDILEADKPILDALRLPQELPVTGRFTNASDAVARACGIFEQGHRLLRLRSNKLSDDDYAALLTPIAYAASEHGAGVLVDRLKSDLNQPGVAGLHLRGCDLGRIKQRPCSQDLWLFASVHCPADILQSQHLQADALVLGHVAPTSSHEQDVPLGWQGFAKLAELAHVPVYAIGGLEATDLERAWRAGAQGIAAISAYW